ncbi:MAG TPA: acetate--CoA ligase family protein [Acidimicrobiales bacterium]|nr:acetate--CoA ligase family protein [Acidimicrobiales bacterium]
MTDTGRPSNGTAPCLSRLLHPKSVAIVGASDDPASIGGAPLALMERFGYAGEVHLVSRTRSEVRGLPCAPSVDDLPEGIDVAILAVPKPGALPALEAAGRRGVGGVIVFSAGYGEVDAAGLAEQEALAAAAREYQIALAGPNCLGLVNFSEGAPLTFGDVRPNRRPGRPGIAIIAQSGAMSLGLTYAAQAQDITVNYAISTGNEAALGVEDYLGAVLEDSSTRAVALLVEQIRRPDEFRALAVTARELGVALCVLHAGQGEKARAATKSHTGAIAGDQGALRAVLEREGVLFAASLDALIDSAGLLSRARLPATKGVGLMTDSGAVKTLAIDVCESIGLPLAELSRATLENLANELPPFAIASNPTDITAMGLNDPSLYRRALEVLLGDEGVGTVVVCTMPGSERQGRDQLSALLPAIEVADKPVVYTVMGGAWPLPEANQLAIWDAGAPLFRSLDRALHAVRDLVAVAGARQAAGARVAPRAMPPLLADGVPRITEVWAKKLLSQSGLRVPRSELAATCEHALKAADRVGYPVVLKVQSPEIVHKSDVGGVAIVGSGAELATSFDQMVKEVSTRCPGARLDGILVEEAVQGGTEVIVGARRDPAWGGYIVIGLGGVWAEVLHDTVIVPQDADRSEIASAVASLRAFPVLSGGRGQPERDVGALIDTVELVAAIFRATPKVVELEVNPLAVLGQGRGTVALDALITLG